MLRPFRPRRPLSLALVASLAAVAPVRMTAQDAPAEAPRAAEQIAAVAPNEMVNNIILRDMPLDQILEMIERYTGRILLRPGSLPPGTYTLTLEKPVPKAEALRALETLLNMNGVALSPLGDRFLKVSNLNQVRTDAPEFIEGSTLELPASGRVASKLFSFEFLRAGEFVPGAAQLLNPVIGAGPITFEKNNAVLFTDTVSTLQRIERLANSLDRPGAAAMTIKSYPIANAKASELVDKLRALISGPLAAQIGSATIFQPDDRTNQVILIGDAREHAFFDQLITKLDAEASPNTRSDVIFLKHANATDVATLLGQLVSGQTTAATREGGGASGSTRSSRRNADNNNATGDGAPPAPPANGAAAAIVNNASASEEFSSYLTIVADERSNAIVVAGTPNDLKLVSSLVDRIDVLLAQVRIEVVIAEVILSNDSSSGINSLGLRVEDNKLTGFRGGFVGGGVTGGAGVTTSADFADLTRVNANAYDLSGIVSLTTTPRKGQATILQTPAITTTHNKEAELFVGETRPVISGTTSSTAGGANPGATTSTVTQQEIGVTLTVTPLIGSSGDVQLEIQTRVEDILGTVQIDGNEQPRVGRRTTSSYVSARNGDIIVLGGLQRSSQSRNTSRLGPIPFLGDLLGARSRSKGRTELIFFLRPTVLTNSRLDNVEVMRRIDSLPQGKDVRAILETRPAAAPEGEPLPPKESPASARSTGPAAK